MREMQMMLSEISMIDAWMAQEFVLKNPKDARTNTLIFNVLAELGLDWNFNGLEINF